MNGRIFLICLVAALQTSSGTVVPAGNEEQVTQDISNDGNALPTAMHANVIVDDEMKLYADGQLIGSNAVWSQAKQFSLPLTAEVIAIEAKNTGGPYGIRASFDGARLVTDTKRWRCRASNAPNWLISSFDDNAWPLAKKVTYTGGTINNNQIVNVNAKWIWTASSEDETVYCRAFMSVEGYVQVDDKMAVYADGKLLGTNSAWNIVKSFTFPGDTHVIAISGENTLGGPYGIRASVNGKKLITSDQGRWHCSNTETPDWEKPSFKETGWAVAKKVTHTSTGTTNIDPTAKWIWGPNPTKTFCRAYLHMYATLIVDDHLEFYADGISMGKGTNWHQGYRFRFPGETLVVAIHGSNAGGGPYGIKGFFGAGRLVTSKTWKCSDSAVPNWNKPTFDDSSWPAATEIAYTGHTSSFTGYPVEGHGSKWIWTNNNAKDVYCRGYIRPVPAVVKGLQDTRPGHAGVGQVDDNTASISGNQEQGNQVPGNQKQGSQVLGNQEQGNQALENQEQGNQVLGNQEQGNQALGNQEQGNQVLGNQEQGSQVLGNHEKGNQALGNQERGNEVQSVGGNFAEDNLPTANNGNMAGSNMATPQVHRVFRKKRPQKRPMRGRFHPAGAKAGIKKLKGHRVFRNGPQGGLSKNNQKVQNDLGLSDSESLINVL